MTPKVQFFPFVMSIFDWPITKNNEALRNSKIHIPYSYLYRFTRIELKAKDMRSNKWTIVITLCSIMQRELLSRHVKHISMVTLTGWNQIISCSPIFSNLLKRKNPHFVLHFVRQLFSFCYMMKNILKSLHIHLINLICACFLALIVKSIQTLNEIYFLAFCGYVLYLNKTNQIYLYFSLYFEICSQ